MKKIFFALLILSVAFLTYGCTQSTSSTSSTAAPAATAEGMSSIAAMYVTGITNSMGQWASSGTVGGMSVSAASVTNKTVTGPDTNGWYHIVETQTWSTYTMNYDTYVKLTETGGVVSGIDVYGTSSISDTSSGTTYTYTVTYGNGASAPYHGAVTGTVGSQLLTVSGALGFSSSRGADSFSISYAFSGFSMPITTGSDYPTGTVTISWTMNGVAQPNVVLTYNGTDTATFAYNGTTSTITLYPASVD